MLALTLTILALLHEPSERDFLRFDLPLTPAYTPGGASPVRAAFQRASAYHWMIDKWKNGYEAYGRADVDDIVRDANWRYEVWWHVDDLADASQCAERRFHAARRLRGLLGPTDYFHGKLPSPWPED